MAESSLREQWNDLYRVTLPEMARRRDPAQREWTVTLDHCFARIILDNAVGRDRPWGEVVQKPAIRSMSDDQLQRAIRLGQQIAVGEKSLIKLDHQSLAFRGKTKANRRLKREHDLVEGHDSHADRHKRTRKGEMADIWERFSACETDGPGNTFTKLSPTVTPSVASVSSTVQLGIGDQDNDPATRSARELCNIRACIDADRSLTSFRRRVLTLLMQIPRGRYSTYKALAAGVASTSPESTAGSSPRAVGSAMRNNPFAPQVPCHRILAADGKIGGFGGDWGDEGRFAKEKRRLLREEGVKFDGHGRVVGSPFTAFT